MLRLDDAVLVARALALEVSDDELSAAERGLADAAPSQTRRQELRAGRAAAREAFLTAEAGSPPSVLQDGRGRPRLDPPGDWFVSLAHDRALACAAVARAPVGVDLLAFAREGPAARVVAERIRSGLGTALLPGSVSPFPESMLLWTAWEALGKRTGEGVLTATRVPLRVERRENVPTAFTAEARVRWFEIEGHLLCLAGALP